MSSGPSRANTVSNLYIMVALLAMFSFNLGSDISQMAQNIGRDDHQLMSWFGLNVSLTAIALPVLALAIYKLIQRLSSLATAQIQSDTLDRDL